MSAWGYIDWRFADLCGPTPAFGWAGTRGQVQCAVIQTDETALWRAAAQVLSQLARHHTPLQGWAQQVIASQAVARAQGNPLLSGWQALQASLGLPKYPEQGSSAAPVQAFAPLSEEQPPDPLTQHNTQLRSLILHTACPYAEFVRRSLQLTSTWLSWSYAALKQGRLDLRKEAMQHWCASFDQLAIMLPDVAVMALHQRLWQQSITWQWQPGEQTRIGQGERQRIVVGAPVDLNLDHPDAWRVPIYTVTGSVGKTTTARLLGQLLRHSGQTLALTASDGAWIGDQRVAEGDCIGGVSARALLQSPAVQAAVFEQGRGGILKQGVPYAHSDVAILLNVQTVHLGVDGIETVEQMADTKVMGLRPARLWVLNHDDAQCRRLASQHPSDATLWFSVTAREDALKALSQKAMAAVGVDRTQGDDPEAVETLAESQPQAITVWRNGVLMQRWSLQDVAPYHGLLGDKTLEELLAAVTAAYFGPLNQTAGDADACVWAARLRALRLDELNHAFRTSVHRQDRVVFVLDKAAEQASLQTLQQAIEHLVVREGCTQSIVVLTRSAGEPPARHLESAQALHAFIDEFICFDRPDTYTTKIALPVYTPGSIPKLLHDELQRLNAQTDTHKPVMVAGEWGQAEAYLRQRLTELPGKTLVLINQPATAATELNQRILAFATNGLNRPSAAEITEAGPSISKATP